MRENLAMPESEHHTCECVLCLRCVVKRVATILAPLIDPRLNPAPYSVASGGLVVVKNEHLANNGTFPTPPVTPPVAKACGSSSNNPDNHAGEVSETAQRQAAGEAAHAARKALPQDAAGLGRRPEVENEDESGAHKRPKIESHEVSVAA